MRLTRKVSPPQPPPRSTPPASSSLSSPSGAARSTPRRPEKVTRVLARVLDAPLEPDRFHASAVLNCFSDSCSCPRIALWLGWHERPAHELASPGERFVMSVQNESPTSSRAAFEPSVAETPPIVAQAAPPTLARQPRTGDLPGGWGWRSRNPLVDLSERASRHRRPVR